MANVLRLAIVDPDDSSRESLKTMLLSMDRIWLEAECSRYDFFSDVVAQTDPDIGIIAIDGDPEKALLLVEQIHEKSPRCNIVVVSASTDGNLILRAMRNGVKEFLSLPLKLEDLMPALERVGDSSLAPGETTTRSSMVLAVAGSTGGVGTTSVAVNLGCALAKEEGNTVVLVDLDLCLGDADVFLDTIADYTLVDVAQNAARLDFSLLKRSLTKHSSGLFLLPSPVQLDDVDLICADDLTRILSLLKATFSHVILDLSKSYGPMDRVALESADQILMLTQLDLPCLRNVVRLMMSFSEMDGIAEKIRIVVNRTGLDTSQISLKRAQETIGREIFWQLPNDYRTMVEVRNNGVPLLEQAPKAAITLAISQMAAAISGNETEVEDSSKSLAGIGRWLNRISGKG